MLPGWQIHQPFAEKTPSAPVTASIARRSAVLRGNLRRGGKQRTQADRLIAATALEHNLALATRNTKDFEGCGVALVNPFEAF